MFVFNHFLNLNDMDVVEIESTSRTQLFLNNITSLAREIGVWDRYIVRSRAELEACEKVKHFIGVDFRIAAIRERVKTAEDRINHNIDLLKTLYGNDSYLFDDSQLMEYVINYTLDIPDVRNEISACSRDEVLAIIDEQCLGINIKELCEICEGSGELFMVNSCAKVREECCGGCTEPCSCDNGYKVGLED